MKESHVLMLGLLKFFEATKKIHSTKKDKKDMLSWACTKVPKTTNKASLPDIDWVPTAWRVSPRQSAAPWCLNIVFQPSNICH